MRLVRRDPHTMHGGAIIDTGHLIPTVDVLSKKNNHSIVYPSTPNTVAPGIDLCAGHRLALILSLGLLILRLGFR